MFNFNYIINFWDQICRFSVTDDDFFPNEKNDDIWKKMMISFDCEN